MRVLHINRNFIFNALHQKLVDALEQKDGYENIVFAPTSEEQNIEYVKRENLIVSKCFKLRDSVFYHYKQHKIYKALKKNVDLTTFDIVHAYTIFTDGNCAMRVKKDYGIPYVVAVRNADVNDFFKKLPFLRLRGIRILQNANKVFFLSETYKSIVMNNYVPSNIRKEIEKKSIIIPNGIDEFWLNNIFIRTDLDYEKKFNSGDKTINIVYAGRIDKNKNIPCTVKAIKILIEEGFMVRFHVVGKVEDQTVYEEIIKEDFLEYHSAMCKEELIKIYRKNDVFVMPSFTETFGLTYVEAMSQGMPVIYTINQGFDGQFAEGEIGYHVDPYNPKEIAEAVKKIIVNYIQLSRRCSENCKKYNWTAISDRYSKIYDNILL